MRCSCPPLAVDMNLTGAYRQFSLLLQPAVPRPRQLAVDNFLSGAYCSPHGIRHLLRPRRGERRRWQSREELPSFVLLMSLQSEAAASRVQRCAHLV